MKKKSFKSMFTKSFCDEIKVETKDIDRSIGYELDKIKNKIKVNNEVKNNIKKYCK